MQLLTVTNLCPAAAAEEAKDKKNMQIIRAYGDANKRLLQLLEGYLSMSTDLGQSFFAKAKAALTDHQNTVFELGSVVAKEAKKGNMAPYQAIKAKVLAMPYNGTRDQIINILS